MAKLGRLCNGTSKSHVHLGPDKKDRPTFKAEADPVWIQRAAECIKESGLLKGSKRHQRGEPQVVLDSHGRKVVYEDSRRHASDGKSGGDSVSQPSAFATPLTLSDSEDEDETEVLPVNPLEHETSDHMFLREHFLAAHWSQARVPMPDWPKWPTVFLAETDIEKLLAATSHVD